MFNRMLLAFLLITIPVLGETPHLLLYFDINKTLIASDKVGNKLPEDVLNELLAEKYAAVWDTSLKTPMTYEKYVHEVLLPGPNDDQNLKKERKKYTHNFLSFLKGTNHPLYPLVLKDYETAMKTLTMSGSIIFPSFYRLLSTLEDKQIAYTIILRSYGVEIFEVGEEINHHYSPIFTQKAEFREGKLVFQDGSIYVNPSEIYSYLRNTTHIAIHDDWYFWNSHAQAIEYGKPFIIDNADSKTLSIFFDDNIEETNMVSNIIAPIDATTGEILGIRDLVDRYQAVKVETLEAILDENYFINCIEKALQKRG